MDLSKLNPWNWFKHEQPGGREQVPVRRSEYPAARLEDPFESLHREFDRLFENLLQRWNLPAGELLPRPPAELMPSLGQGFRPRLNIAAEDDRYTVTIDVPGLDADNVAVELSGNRLVVKGHCEQESEDRQQHYYRIERASGAFQRTLTLPDDVDGDGITAAVKNGLMTLRIPRKQSAPPAVRRIPIDR